MASQLQSVSTVDLYYICQVVDNVARDSSPYLRNIENIFGDMASVSLARSYPKWTCFHIFIEEVISSIILEEADVDEIGDRKLWVDHLLEANGFKNVIEGKDELTAGEYIETLLEDGDIEMLCEKLAMQVFHVLFSNRYTMSSFGRMVNYYVTGPAPEFAPDAYGSNGYLKRTHPPAWAKNAVFHRDKGRCVLCKTDLTKLYSQKSAIHYDHIIPLAMGGINCVTNLQLTCAECNLRKGGMSASTSLEYETWYNYEVGG